jgi:dTDP-4-dehydrorhamnose reductase
MQMIKRQNVLITGSNGLLGQSLVKKFLTSYRVLGCDLAEENYNAHLKNFEYIQLDITSREGLQHLNSTFKPDIIINAAAYTDVDRSEQDRDLCWAVNVRAVELMLEMLSNDSAIFIHISTDYVFDGKRGYYRETDETKPVSYYGQTKLAAEKIVRSSRINYIIARSQVLYGAGKKIRNNFVLWVMDQLKNKKKIRIVNDQRGNPTLADDLSEAVFRLLQMREFGLFHIAGSQVCTRLEFARKIADIFKLDQSLIEETSSKELKQKAVRPTDSSFNLDKLSNVLDWLPGNLDESLEKLKSRQVTDHGK